MAGPTLAQRILDLFEDGALSAAFVPGLKIYRAKVGGANPGALYVKSHRRRADVDHLEPEYYGKIDGGSVPWHYHGEILGAGWRPTDAGQYWGVTEGLEALALGGVEYLAQLGRESGICSFCSKALEDPESVGCGYGPVCARKHGLPHSNKNGF